MHDPAPARAYPGGDRLRFDRRRCGDECYRRAARVNAQLAAMYDSFARTLADVAGDGSYLDLCCNSGYLPVRVSHFGVRASFGCDLGDFSACFSLLNAVTGSTASFFRCRYDPTTHRVVFPTSPPRPRFDVVSSLAFLCHVPDPLHFLRALADLASKAVFIWTGVIESNELLIRYNPPQVFSDEPFPNGFDSGTAISTGLLRLAMKECGLSRCEELPWQPGWLPPDWTRAHMPEYQTFKPFLFLR
jgi:hypothetical protein